MVEPESAETVRARFSKVIMPKSGVHEMRGGRSTESPGVIRKSTLLSLKASPDTGAAYHQLRSQAFQPGCTSVGSKYEPSPISFPVTRRMPCAHTESASARKAVSDESQAPGASVSVEKQRVEKVGSPRP